MCPAVGPAPETASHLLSEFRQKGILPTEGRAVTLLVPERLKALTGDRFGAALSQAP
jgi:hypothetical protein